MCTQHEFLIYFFAGGTPVITLELPQTLFSAWDSPEKDTDQV